MCDQPIGQNQNQNTIQPSGRQDGSGDNAPIPCVEQNRNCCKTDVCTGNLVMPPGPSCPGTNTFTNNTQQISQPQPVDCPIKEFDPCLNPCARIPGQHPFCPPGQTIGILPQSYVRGPEFPRPVQKPCVGPPPKLPWYQCKENYMINDQVRRPMGRWCHIRELPPLVIPCSEINRIQEKICSSSGTQRECEELKAKRERERQASYQRHSQWNYTVSSLLARKKKEEEENEKKLVEEYCQLTKAIKDNRDKYSAEKIARARQQLLYRKGLIKDFHAAMAYSKSLKEMEDQRKQGGRGRKFGRCGQNRYKETKVISIDPKDREQDEQTKEECKDYNKSPVEDEPCMKNMMWENRRTDNTKKAQTKKPCNPRLLELLKCDEGRVAERQAELEKEKAKLHEMRTVEALPWPPSYIKYLEEPKCEESNEQKWKEKDKLRQGIFLEIHDKLAAAAFVESAEQEVERQACEYNEYKRKVDRMRKEKEKQLIEEKVAYNMAQSEKAAQALIESKSRKKDRTNVYDCLKAQWEAEYEEKVKNGGKGREILLKKVAEDFAGRKDRNAARRAELDATREWEKQCCYAVQDYEKQCEIENTRRDKAKEIAKYQMEQVADRVNREEAERHLNAAWGEKSKCNYACEMKEMKDYAYSQIKEWQAKGRPVYPMLHAMKKWDYDAGMTPFLYSQTSCGPLCTTFASEDAIAAKKANCPAFETTAERLGFCNGGT